MLIDWFTVVAQAINFLVLVWLLKRYLYGPILDAIDAREQRIARVLTEAEKEKGDAQKQRDEYNCRNQEFIEERKALMSQMEDELDARRSQLLEDAHQAAYAVSAKHHEALQREQKAFGEELARRAEEQVFSIARKALHDLADASLEERITTVFTRRVRDMNDSTKQELAEALAASSEPARVRSAFELPAEQQATIRQTLNDAFAADIPVSFEIAPNGIGGIELISSGRKVAWNIDEYLTLLQKSIAELSDSQKKRPDEATEVENESAS